MKFRTPLNGLLAGSALIVGTWMYGWRGLVLGVTVVVFWAVLQFKRATRVMQNVAQRPKGLVDSVVMTQSRLSPGMDLSEVLIVTGSLGVRVNGRDEWSWHDAGGDQLVVVMRRGVVVRWEVARADAPETGPALPQPAPDSD